MSVLDDVYLERPVPGSVGVARDMFQLIDDHRVSEDFCGPCTAPIWGRDGLNGVSYMRWIPGKDVTPRV